jgi:anti-sigma B factor antagonist
MSFRTSRQDDTIIIGVEGQLVAGNRQQLRETVTSEIEKGVRSFIIDFADTGYIDSAGLGALVSLFKRIREAHGTLRLTNLNEDLRTLFELTRLDTLFALDNDSGAAGAVADRPVTPAPPRQDGPARPRSDGDARA